MCRTDRLSRLRLLLSVLCGLQPLVPNLLHGRDLTSPLANLDINGSHVTQVSVASTTEEGISDMTALQTPVWKTHPHVTYQFPTSTFTAAGPPLPKSLSQCAHPGCKTQRCSAYRQNKPPARHRPREAYSGQDNQVLLYVWCTAQGSQTLWRMTASARR